MWCENTDFLEFEEFKNCGMSCIVIIFCHPESFNMFYTFKDTMRGWSKEIHAQHEEGSKKQEDDNHEQGLLKPDCSRSSASEKQEAEWTKQGKFYSFSPVSA